MKISRYKLSNLEMPQRKMIKNFIRSIREIVSIIIFKQYPHTSKHKQSLNYKSNNQNNKTLISQLR